MKLTMQETLPHFEYEQMEVNIEPHAGDIKITVEVADGRREPTSMSLEDFDRLAETVAKYRQAQRSIQQVAA